MKKDAATLKKYVALKKLKNAKQIPTKEKFCQWRLSSNFPRENEINAREKIQKVRLWNSKVTHEETS